MSIPDAKTHRHLSVHGAGYALLERIKDIKHVVIFLHSSLQTLLAGFNKTSGFDKGI